MKKKQILLLLALSLTLGSCGIFKEKCHCPKFGQKSVPSPAVAAAKAHVQVQ